MIQLSQGNDSLFGWTATAGWAGWMLRGARCLASPVAPPANPVQSILGSETGCESRMSWSQTSKYIFLATPQIITPVLGRNAYLGC